MFKKQSFRIAVIFPLLFLSITSFSQKSLTLHKRFGGHTFEYTEGDSVFVISAKQVSFIMKDDPMALGEFKKAKANSSFAGVMGFAGGILVGIPLGTAIAGGDPEWILAAGGAALILGSIPLNKAFTRHAENAIDIYNKKHTAFRLRTNYYLAGAGVKIVMKF